MKVKNGEIMTRLRVGIVGLGAMGKLYADALTRNPLAKVKAVADVSGKELEFAKTNYNCDIFEGYQQMYAAGDLDLVIITLPDFMHRDPVIKAAEKGFHILVEKPFATSMSDADAMVESINKAGVKCMVEFFNRWSSPFAHAKRRVEAGDIGEIITFNIELNDAVIVPTKMLKWSSKSSPAWFLMSHTSDLAFWITGKKPSSVCAVGVKKILHQMGMETYDLIEALVEYPDGTMGRFTNSWILPNGMPFAYELKMRIVGSKAAIDIDTSDQEVHLVTQDRITHPVTAWADILGSFVGHPYTMLQSLIDSILNDKKPLVDHMDGWYTTKFLDAVHQSVETGKKINIQW